MDTSKLNLGTYEKRGDRMCCTECGQPQDSIKRLAHKLGCSSHGPHLLTPREMQVIAAMGEGLSVKEIATKFNLSCKTVEAHKFNLMRKLDLHSRAAVVRWVMTRLEGYVQPTVPTISDFYLTQDSERSLMTDFFYTQDRRFKVAGDLARSPEFMAAAGRALEAKQARGVSA